MDLVKLLAKLQAIQEQTIEEDDMAEGYTLQKTNVTKNFVPGYDDEVPDSEYDNITYKIVNNRTGKVVGTATRISDPDMRSEYLEITVNGRTRNIPIYPSEDPQAALNKFLKDPKTSKKYTSNDMAESWPLGPDKERKADPVTMRHKTSGKEIVVDRSSVESKKAAGFEVVKSKSSDNDMAEGYTLQKTNVTKNFVPGYDDEVPDSEYDNITYKIVNNRTGKVVGTATRISDPDMRSEYLEITVNGRTRNIPIYPSEDPQAALNKFLKDPKTSKKYTSNDVEEGNEFAKKVQDLKAQGAKPGTKFKTSDGKEHVLEAEKLDECGAGMAMSPLSAMSGMEQQSSPDRFTLTITRGDKNLNVTTDNPAELLQLMKLAGVLKGAEQVQQEPAQEQVANEEFGNTPAATAEREPRSHGDIRDWGLPGTARAKVRYTPAQQGDNPMESRMFEEYKKFKTGK